MFLQKLSFLKKIEKSVDFIVVKKEHYSFSNKLQVQVHYKLNTYLLYILKKTIFMEMSEVVEIAAIKKTFVFMKFFCFLCNFSTTSFVGENLLFRLLEEVSTEILDLRSNKFYEVLIPFCVKAEISGTAVLEACSDSALKAALDSFEIDSSFFLKYKFFFYELALLLDDFDYQNSFKTLTIFRANVVSNCENSFDPLGAAVQRSPYIKLVEKACVKNFFYVMARFYGFLVADCFFINEKDHLFYFLEFLMRNEISYFDILSVLAVEDWANPDFLEISNFDSNSKLFLQYFREFLYQCLERFDNKSFPKKL